MQATRGSLGYSMMRVAACAQLLAAICLLCSFPGDGRTQGYPVKVVRYVVPGSAGSGADVLGRILAGGLGQVFGQQVIVDNRAGAGGNIGAELAAKAAADGHTVLQISLTHALNVSLYRRLPYDLLRDFSPVTQLASTPSLVVVHPSLPVKSVGDLVKLARAKPGAINYASAGTGTPTFLAAELFKGQAGVNLVHVPYKGGAEAMTSVISGETSVYFPAVTTAMPLVRRGSLRALAVTTAQRLPSLPQYPSVAEAGYPHYQSGNWYGLMVPAKTPRETIATLRNAAVAALNSPALNKRLNDLGFVPIGDQPEAFAAHIKSQIATLAKVVDELHLAVD
jgi:tripartite-type tricarboxylate transporter receptor subunit TctC